MLVAAHVVEHSVTDRQPPTVTDGETAPLILAPGHPNAPRTNCHGSGSPSEILMAVAQLGETALNAPAIPGRKNAQGTELTAVAAVRNTAIHRPRNRIRLGDQDSEQGRLPVADQSARSAAHLLRNSKKMENHSHTCATKTTHPGELALERSHKTVRDIAGVNREQTFAHLLQKLVQLPRWPVARTEHGTTVVSFQ